MLSEIRQKLSGLKAQGWDEILIRHEQEDGSSTVAIHTVYGNNEDQDGKPLAGVMCSKEPILAADDLPALKDQLLRMLDLVKKKLITSVEEIEEYNQQVN